MEGGDGDDPGSDHQQAGGTIEGGCVRSSPAQQIETLGERRVAPPLALVLALGERQTFAIYRPESSLARTMAFGQLGTFAALGLWLVRQHSPTLAGTTARYLLFDGRPSQATYAMADHLAHADSLVERFERWARANLARFTMADASGPWNVVLRLPGRRRAA